MAWAFSFARTSVGKSIAAKIAMTTMTTSSSINVKAHHEWERSADRAAAEINDALFAFTFRRCAAVVGCDFSIVLSRPVALGANTNRLQRPRVSTPLPGC